jgi:hypothetical protein
VPRCTGALAGLLLPVVAMGALGGCSSSKDGDGADDAGSSSGVSAGDGAGKGGGRGGSNGRLDYTGSLTGGFDVTRDVGCAFEDGRFSGVQAPNDRASDTPESFSGSFVSGGLTVLITKDVKVFITSDAGGLSAAKKDGTWAVTLSGTRLTDAVDDETITVNGHLTCTKLVKL